jgi:tetratricopeptide (TPR) repeat protein
VAIAEYLQGPAVSAEVNDALQVELERALVSSWKRILDAACPVLQATGCAVASGLPDAWRACEAGLPAADRVQFRGGWYDEAGTWQRGGDRLGWVTAFIAMRNRIAHDPVPPPAENQRRTTELISVLDRLLGAHAWLLDHDLCRVRADIVESLRGDGEPRPLRGVSASPDGSSLFLRTGDDTRLDLLPLLVVPSEVVAEHTGKDAVLLYEKDLGKTILYIGPRGARVPSRRTVRRFRRLVADKRVVVPRLSVGELDAEAVRTRAATTRARAREGLEAVGAIVERGYEPRPVLEGRIDDWLRGPTPLLALVGEGGAGKSALLAEMVRRWAGEDRVVVHLRAAELATPELARALQVHLDLAEDVTPRDVAAAMPPGEALVVVVDALDEQVGGSAFLADAERWAAESGALKVVLSTRRLGPDEDPRTRPGLWWAPAREDGPQERGAGALAVGPLDWAEVCRVWARISTARRLKPRFGPEALRKRYRLATRGLTTPLEVRLWLEAYDGRSLPRAVSYGDVRRLRLARAAEQSGDDGALLSAIARLALGEPDGTVLLERLFDHPVIGPEVRSRALRSPYRRLLRFRLLTERRSPDGRVVAAPVPGLLAHAAGDVLVAEGRADTPAALAAEWARLDGHLLRFEAFRRALDLQVRRHGLGFLVAFVDLAGAEVRNVAGVVLAQWVVAGGSASEAGAALARELTDADLLAAASAAEDLGAMRQFDEGYTLLRAVLAGAEVGACRPHARAVFWDELAARARGVGELEAALAAREQELAARHADPEEDPSVLALTCCDVAQANLDLERFEQVSEHLGVARRLVEEHGLRDLTSLIDNTAGLLAHQLGDWKEAEAAFTRVLAADMAMHGPDSPELAAGLNNLGLIALEDGRPDEALARFLRVVALHEAHRGADAVVVGEHLSNVGLAHLHLGDVDAGVAALRRAVGILEDGLGPEHPDLVIVVGNLGSALAEAGEIDEGIALLRRAAGIAEAELEPSDSRRLRAALQLLDVVIEQPDVEPGVLLAGLDELRDGLEACANPGLTVHFAIVEGRLRLLAEEVRPAVDVLRAGLVVARERLLEGAPMVGLVLLNQGIALGQAGEVDEARAVLAEALAHQEAGGRAGSGHALIARTTLVRMCCEAGDWGAAAGWLDRALAADHPPIPLFSEAAFAAWRVIVAERRGEDGAPARQRLEALEARSRGDGGVAGEVLGLEVQVWSVLDKGRAAERLAVLSPQLDDGLEASLAWDLALELDEDLDAALPLLERCLDAERRAEAPAPARAQTLRLMAVALLGLERLDEARARVAEATALLEALGSDPEALAETRAMAAELEALAGEE